MRRWIGPGAVAAFLPVMAPLVVCLAAGSLTASLWLDEILYFYLQSDLALRAAEIGRPSSAVAPWFSSFAFCDVQRLFQALLRPLGLLIETEPELTMRLLPLLSYVGASVLVYRHALRDAGRLDAALRALAFSSLPLVLYYAFEARVYSFTIFLVVLFVTLLDRTEESASTFRYATLGIVGLLTAHAHLWTVCLFVAIAGDAVVRAVRARALGPDVRARLVGSIPAVVLVGAEFVYMKLTDPGNPPYPPFQPQSADFTIRELLISNFAGPMQTQYLVLIRLEGFVLSSLGAALLVAITVLAWRAAGSSRRHDILAACAALLICVVLATAVGFYQHARYHLPLLAALLFYVLPNRGRMHRALLGCLILVNCALMPDTLEQLARKSDGRLLASRIEGRFPDRRSVGIVFQHLPTGGYPFPAHAVALDFYLNALHPDLPAVPLYELPMLGRIDGRRGVYELFASDQARWETSLEIRPELWRRKIAEMPQNVVLVHPFAGVDKSRLQLAVFSSLLESSPGRSRGHIYRGFGFPHHLLVEFPVSRPLSDPETQTKEGRP